ncbi:MAG TPA: hypothetical protein VF643_08320 [Sphingomonas sp.]|jgi:hypothetical protein
MACKDQAAPKIGALPGTIPCALFVALEAEPRWTKPFGEPEAAVASMNLR